VFSQDFAGLGGDVRYIRTRIDADKYWGIGSGFIFSVGAEGGYIHGLGQDIRLTDRFFLGEPQIRGFDIRGVGPRVIRRFYDTTTTDPTDFVDNKDNNTDDALGGKAYYLAHAELEIPLGSGARELGLRPSIFVDAGAVFGAKRPETIDTLLPGSQKQCLNSTTSAVTTTTGDCPAGTTQTGDFAEQYLGNSPKPRVSVGVGVNWNSPFGPFRIDIAKALVKEPGDQTKLFTFNVGTQF
jgi:outer membrane protein insertion porin family